MKEWIKTSERMPLEGQEVWVAGEMKYDYETKMRYFVGIGWLHDIHEIRLKQFNDTPEDVKIWGTLNDWYEGEEHFKITHWMEIDEPEHPIEN